jgi:carbon-monoxide dehydrogenase medium subunit
MKPPPFAYHRPDTRAAVDGLLAEHGDEAKILAGGQSLLPILNMRLSAPAHLIDINGLTGEPSEPVVDGGAVRFGPLVRQAAAEHWPQLATQAPAIGEALAYTAHPAIRSRGTIVGSVAHADPSAELPATLLALDGEVRCRSVDGVRSIPARELFVDALETALKPTEWLEQASVPARRPGEGHAVEELARRHGDYAICGVVAVARRRPGDGAAVTLVYFGIGPVPVRIELEDGADLRDAIAGLEFTEDLHATAAYRRRLAEVLGARAGARAQRRALEQEPA